MGALYIKYTWSIGNCANWYNIPAPSSCRSLVAFNAVYTSGPEAERLLSTGRQTQNKKFMLKGPLNKKAFQA